MSCPWARLIGWRWTSCWLSGSCGDVQIAKIEEKIQERHQKHKTASILATLPGASVYSSLALASRIGAIENFPRPGSLANYWGFDAWLPQFRRCHRSAGVDHQGRKYDGPDSFWGNWLYMCYGAMRR